MNDADNKSEIVTENDKKAEEGLGCFIARVSVLTVICAFVVLSLAAALIGCLFPKAYMDMYRGLGAYGKASDYAAAALMRESHSAECEESACAYMNLLESAVGIAVIAAEDGTEASYTRLYEFTDAYVSAPCRAKHSARVDATYIKEYGKNLAVLSVLYGYDGYVAGERIRAMCAIGGGKADEAEADVNEKLNAPDGETLCMLVAYTAERRLDAEQLGKTKTVFAAYKYASDSLDGIIEEATGARKTELVATKANLLYRLMSLADNLSDEDYFGTAVGVIRREYTEFINGIIPRDKPYVRELRSLSAARGGV